MSQFRNQYVYNQLKRHGISATIAELAVQHELTSWTPQQVEDIFSHLRSEEDLKSFLLGPNTSIPKGRKTFLAALAFTSAFMLLPLLYVLRSFRICFLLIKGRIPEIRSMLSGNNPLRHLSIFFHVKAPIEKIKDAARNEQALCVNRDGRFEVRSGGYIALSYVWAELMCWTKPEDEKWEIDDRGINKQHFDYVFKKFSRTGCSWMWWDLLSMPPDLPNDLRALVTNTLSKVYRNADAVVVLDALTQRLEVRNTTDIAVALRCGKWMTRLWTYQESVLARDLIVITANTESRFSELMAELEEQASANPALYGALYQTFQRLRPLQPHDISLQDIAIACRHRTTGCDIDNALSFFPTLGLPWRPDYDRIQGMTRIIQTRLEQAAHLASLHGVRGLPPPYGWAPAYLAGLPSPPSAYEDDSVAIQADGSLSGRWTSFRIVEIERQFRGWDGEMRMRLKTVSSGDAIGTMNVKLASGLFLHRTRSEKVRVDGEVAATVEWWIKSGMACVLGKNVEGAVRRLVGVLLVKEDEEGPVRRGRVCASGEVLEGIVTNGDYGSWILT
jgi:hypothetical protein